MNPIKIKLSTDQIMALEHMMQIDSFKRETMKGKAMYSILLGISDKVNSKYRKIKDQINLFNTKKSTSLELKYHEAYVVYTLSLLYLGQFDKESKPYNDILKINLDLHKKMQ